MNSQQNTHQIYQDNSDEIDLLQLCANIWRSKWIIIGIMVLCIIPTVIWLQWQSSVYKLETLFNGTSTYDIQALQPSKLTGGERYEVSRLKSKDVYQELLTQVTSLNAQKLFWEQWTKTPLSRDSTTEPTENDIAFKKFFASLTLIPPNPKIEGSTLSQINLESANPERDIKILTAYIDFLNTHVVRKFVSLLDKGYESNIQNLQFDYSALKRREQQKLEDSLLELEESLNLARALNIVETPYKELSGIELKVVDDRQYLLGSKVLSQEIKSLEARSEKSLSAFVPDLRNMEYWQEILANDYKKLRTTKNDIRVFNTVSPVVSSLDPVKPKKVLILLGVIFLSAIIGVIVALVIHAMKSYQERPKKVS